MFSRISSAFTLLYLYVPFRLLNHDSLQVLSEAKGGSEQLELTMAGQRDFRGRSVRKIQIAV